MKKLIIIGCGGTSEVIADAFMRDSDFEVVAFAVEQAYVPSSPCFCGLPVLPYENLEKRCPASEFSFFVGIGGTALNALRRRFFTEMLAKGYIPASLLSSRASISPRASLGAHCLILENVVIHAGCRIGDNVMIFPNAYTGHHTVIEPHCFIAAGVAIAGYAHIKEKSFLGAGACIANSITVGTENFISMGARVTQSTADGIMVKSAPATVMPEAKERFLRWHKQAAALARQQGAC
jgi:sugar O-acyltransferase (sialic acid O-acetyltransferase NeuD family)